MYGMDLWEIYLQLLEELVTPTIIAVLENDRVIYDPIFQQN